MELWGFAEATSPSCEHASLSTLGAVPPIAFHS